MEHSRNQRDKNKWLENNFMPINISINDMDRFEKKKKRNEENKTN